MTNAQWRAERDRKEVYAELTGINIDPLIDWDGDEQIHQTCDRVVGLADVEDLVETIIHTEISPEDAMAYAWMCQNGDNTWDTELVEAFRSNLNE